MSEDLKKIALPLLLLGFYPLVKLLSEITINLPVPGKDINCSLHSNFIGYSVAIFGYKK